MAKPEDIISDNWDETIAPKGEIRDSSEMFEVISYGVILSYNRMARGPSGQIYQQYDHNAGDWRVMNVWAQYDGSTSANDLIDAQVKALIELADTWGGDSDYDKIHIEVEDMELTRFAPQHKYATFMALFSKSSQQAYS